MGAALTPPHLLLLYYPLADHLICGRLESGYSTLYGTPGKISLKTTGK